jgi:hypothetical protein
VHALDLRAADGRGRTHCGEVLSLQAGLGFASAEIHQVYRLTRQQRQGDAAAEHLAAALARGTVDFDDANAFASAAQKLGFWVFTWASILPAIQFVEARVGRGLAVIGANMGFGCHKINQVSARNLVYLNTVLFFG